jgi:hypothetical protein
VDGEERRSIGRGAVGHKSGSDVGIALASAKANREPAALSQTANAGLFIANSRSGKFGTLCERMNFAASWEFA